MTIFLSFIFFFILAYTLVKRFNCAKKTKSVSAQSLEEIKKQHDINENKILIAIEKQQQKDIGNV